MNNYNKRLSSVIVFYTILILSLISASTFAQIVTNGGFESSDVGDITATGTEGWFIQVTGGIDPAPVLEIVSDTVQEGSRALKVIVNGLGGDPWDIQVVADSLNVKPQSKYQYSVWAKSENPGAQVSFTVGNYSYAEYGAIRNVILTTQWKKYSMQFTVDDQTIIRGPIHFSYAASVENPIYIDNLQIDTVAISYPGPPLAEGQAKFLGNVCGSTPDPNFADYWTQLTPENSGKFGTVADIIDTTQWNWSGLDAAYNYAKENNLIFKHHCLIWGNQQPSWISDLDSAQQIYYLETWIRMNGEKYPDMDMVDVVNEPLAGHAPPDGANGRANYINALGGTGATGWDWVINSFLLAREYLPDAELLINDYGIIENNATTTSYLTIINLLKDRELIDGIGVQGHRFELENADTNTIKYNLNRLAETGLPIYISEMDLGNLGDTGTPNDGQQLQLYQKIFPVLWKHPGVKGITLWGYIEGQIWQTTCYLVRSDGTVRPALLWLADYIKNNPVGIEQTVSTLPSNFQLEQNFPNPFNPSTIIRYRIVKTVKVTLKVYDVLGREIKTLVNRVQTPGQYTATFDARNFASGVYLYRIRAGNFIEAKKLLLLK
jgi:GH35 family endo-1,4-beta-xylanase